MGARTDQEIELLRAVVYGVKAPQEGDFMRPAVAPVESEIANDEGGQPAQPKRPGGNRSMQAPWHEMVCDIRHEGQRNREQQVGQQAADQIIADIAGETLVEDL